MLVILNAMRPPRLAFTGALRSMRPPKFPTKSAGNGCTTSWNFCATLPWVVCAVRVTVKVPLTFGVPLTRPVRASNFSPDGRPATLKTSLETDHENAPLTIAVGGESESGPAPVKAMLSNDAAASAPLLCAVRQRPISAVFPIAMVSRPISFQFAPSLDAELMKTLPARSIFTHHGAPPAVASLLLSPLNSTRRWKAIPLSGVTAVIACLDDASSVSRIITPALAQPSVCETVSTRATSEPSPTSA